MEHQKIKTANLFRNIARYGLLILTSVVIVFALISGSEGYGGGINGIIQNSPNALPWVLLLVFALIAWKSELIGGALITMLGLVFVYYFCMVGSTFYLITFLLTTTIVLLGIFFLLSWRLRKVI